MTKLTPLWSDVYQGNEFYRQRHEDETKQLQSGKGTTSATAKETDVSGGIIQPGPLL